MKCLKIKCRVCGTMEPAQFYIKIYNIKKELIFDSVTDSLGCVVVNFPYDGVYNITITSSNNLVPKEIKRVLYVYDFCPDTLLFNFNNINNYESAPIKFVVTDTNYKGLPIMKGELILWQKNT